MPPDVRNAPSEIQESLFGTLAVRYNFVLEHQVKEALDIQKQMKQAGQAVPRMGEILAQRGYITIDQVQAVLKGQLSSSPRRFGEIAVASHFCAHAEVEAALQVQNQIKACGSAQRLGEILVARGALRPHQVHAVLKEQGKAIIACPGCSAKLNVSGVSPGSSVSCPRCKAVFRPPSAGDSVIVDQSDPGALRADVTVTLPAVGQSHGGISRLANAVIGPYQLGEKLGSDSSGVLYKAFDPQHGTHVALRMLNPATANTRQAIDRWISAGEAASELSHPNLQRILSINTDAGRVYLVLEYVDGESLRKSIARRTKFPVLEAVDVLIQMAEALAYGHSHGFLHGDLRPAHVLIGFDGIVRISGLGTPKNVSQNLRQVAGQLGDEALPLYTPPELMIDEDNAEERSDIYSLGAIGYQMMSGRPPHEGTNVLQVGLRMASEAIRPPRDLEPRIPPYVNRVICRCLLPEPDDRYDNMAALLDDLRKARQALLGDVADIPEIGAAPRTSGVRPGVGIAPRRNLKAEAQRKGKLRTHISRGGHGSSTGRSGAVTGKHKSPARSGARSSGSMHAVQSPAMPTPVGSSPALPKVQLNRPPRKNAAEDEPVDLLGDIDPLAVETTRAHTAPSEHADDEDEDHEERELSAAERRKKLKEGPPLDPGVSAKWVLIGTGGAVLLVIGLIVLLGNKNPVPGPAIAATDKPKTEPATPLVVVASNPAATTEWRQVQDHIKANPQDFQGIVQRLGAFKLKYVDTPTPAEQARDAVEQLRQYSGQGATASLPELRSSLARKLEAEHFSEAGRDVENWKEQWKGDADTAKTANTLLEELAAKQKQMAGMHMNSAMAARKEKKWEQAYALYKRVAENYAPQFADAARKARIDAMGDADASRGGEEKELAARRAAEAQAARDAAAPARLQTLLADMDSALKTFDLEQGKRLLDNTFELLSGTPQGPDFQELKNDYAKILALRDRMVKAVGKLSDPKVTYRNQQFVVVSAAEKGPIIEAGTGKVPISWTEISADDLDTIAKRACNPDNGSEMLELGMLRYHMGDYRDAKKTLSEAQRLGAVTTRYMARVDAKLKDLAAKPAEPVPEKTPEKAPEKTPEPAKAPDKPAPVDEEVVKALAAKGLEINRGVWVLSGNIFRGVPDAGDTETKLMSLKAGIKKNFSKVSVEVRGLGGDQAGFSFGKGRRFVVRPDGGWQKVTVERNNGGRPQLTVDGKPVDSLDKPDAGVNPDNLVLDGILYLRFQGPKGEFRNFAIDN